MLTRLFEAFYWFGLILVMYAMFYENFFVILLWLGISLMLLSMIKEGIHLNLIEKRKIFEKKHLHFLIFIIGLIAIIAFISYKGINILNLKLQSVKFVGSPLIVTWWIFMLIGLVIGLSIIMTVFKTKELKSKKHVHLKIRKFLKIKYIIFFIIFIFTLLLFIKYNIYTSIIIAFLIILSIAYFVVVFAVHRLHKKHKVEVKKIPEKVEASIKGKSLTNIDKLYLYVKQKKVVRISEVEKLFKIKTELAEEWAKILESHNLIKINYSTMGEMELCEK